MNELTRRSLLGGFGAFVAGAFGRCHAEDAGLGALAMRRGIGFGCAVSSETLRNDPAFAAAVRRDACVLVPETELKAQSTWPARNRFDFCGGDFIADFADANGMHMRGHTLLWHVANPPWLVETLKEHRPAESLLRTYIGTVMGRYRGRIREWDVVNEAVDPKFAANDRVVDNPWFTAYGPGVIETAFHIARETDPNARLFYCDGNTEGVAKWQLRRRGAVLRLLERLRAKGVPIDGFALQGHIKPFIAPFDEKNYAEFLKEVRALGLKIIVSEFDVADKGGDPDPVKRDATVAIAAKAFLDVVFDSPATDELLSWGLSDKYSWLSAAPKYSWPAGQKARGLPLDAAMQKTPLWHAIAASFASASKRAT